jgi:hypothetical protein
MSYLLVGSAGAFMGGFISFINDDYREELKKFYPQEPLKLGLVYSLGHVVGGALSGLFAKMGAEAMKQFYDCAMREINHECSLVTYLDCTLLILPTIISAAVIVAQCLPRPRPSVEAHIAVVTVTINARGLENLVERGHIPSG